MQVRLTEPGERSASPEGSPEPRRDEKLRKSCAEFESLFLYEILKTMRRTIPKCDLFHGGQGEELFEQLFDQEVSRSLSSRRSVGLGDLLYRQLQGVLPSAAGDQ